VARALVRAGVNPNIETVKVSTLALERKCKWENDELGSIRGSFGKRPWSG
jgi:hypothetical protein